MLVNFPCFLDITRHHGSFEDLCIYIYIYTFFSFFFFFVGSRNEAAERDPTPTGPVDQKEAAGPTKRPGTGSATSKGRGEEPAQPACWAGRTAEPGGYGLQVRLAVRLATRFVYRPARHLAGAM